MVCEPTDPCWVYQGQLNMMSPSMVTVGSITSDISNVEPSFRQRTKAEAAVRAYEGLSNFNAFAKVPFFKPYIYALNALTYGLILVDPLDRLE